MKRSSSDKNVRRYDVVENEKSLLRTHFTWLTRREEESLCVSSSKYLAWEADFVQRFERLRLNGVHSAKDIARLLGRENFKTIGGVPLDARLVALLRDKFRRENRIRNPKNSLLREESPLKRKVGKHTSHYEYRPMPSSQKDED